MRHCPVSEAAAVCNQSPAKMEGRMILRELTALHEEWQSMVDGMERDGVAEAYPHDYQKAKQRAEFYLTAA